MADALVGCRAKIERAGQHLIELRGRVDAFFGADPKPYVVSTKRDSETRQLVYYLASVAEPPIAIALIAGDVLQSLRSALDHLAYQLVRVGDPTIDPSELTYVYFPIGDSATNYGDRKARYTTGMQPAALDAIDALKPYRGENDTLWRIQRLNIVDKHRLLITVGSRFHGFDFGAHMHATMLKAWPDLPAPELSLLLHPADRLFPLKVGDDLFIDSPDAEVDENMQFQFDIALSEPDVIGDEPLIEMLAEMIDVVERLVHTFEPLLR